MNQIKFKLNYANKLKIIKLLRIIQIIDIKLKLLYGEISPPKKKKIAQRNYNLTKKGMCWMKGCDDRREMGEELDDEREILKQVFGDSSEDEDCEDQTVIGDSAYEGGHIRRWEQAKEIKGLWLCRSFLSPQQESSLLSAIRNGSLSRNLSVTFLQFLISSCFERECRRKLNFSMF